MMMPTSTTAFCDVSVIVGSTYSPIVIADYSSILTMVISNL